MRVLLDTHVVLWWQADTDRLSVDAAKAIRDASAIFVSALTCWEISSLARRERVRLDRDPRAWIDKLMRTPSVMLAPLSPEAAVWAGQLDRSAFPGDPIDRLIYATSHDLRIPLVTKDERLRAYAADVRDIDVIW